MVRLNNPPAVRKARSRGAARAIAFALGLGAAGQAAAQANPLSFDSLGGPAFASVVDGRAADSRMPLLGDEPDAEDCDPQPLAAGNNYTMLLAKADIDTLSTRAGRSRKPAGKETAREQKAAPAAAPAPGVPAPAPDANREWEIVVADKTLNATMARWAATAGWQLLWELPVDYAVEARTRVHGTFEEAVATVARSMETAEIPMKAVFYQGNKVLRIMAKGSE